jgi:exodeoxyribonuclease VII large subunit
MQALQYERLKARLNEEGLFDFEHKKEIVKFPRAIGVIAAGRGSAIEDVKGVAKTDNPYVQLIFYPSKVQGAGAAASIVRGIRILDAMEEVDTIILARGGGSDEDLLTFNDEGIVRAVFEANTPIIAGLGHADYITLTDYVADLRVITPTDAAHRALPNVMTNINQLRSKERLLQNNMSNLLRLTKSRLNTLETKLYGLSPERRLADQKKHLEVSTDRLKRGMDRRFEQARHRYGVIVARLNALSPAAKLVGGFGYVESGGKPLTSAKDVKTGDKIEITVSDGVVKATAD